MFLSHKACNKPKKQRLKVGSILGRKYSIRNGKQNSVLNIFLLAYALKLKFYKIYIYIIKFA